MGEWIIRQSCEAAAKWPERIRIAVNISAYQLHSPGLVDVIKDALRTSQLSAERLEIEITESEKLDKSIALPVLQEIRSLGIEIAMDDLGTGLRGTGLSADLSFYPHQDCTHAGRQAPAR